MSFAAAFPRILRIGAGASRLLPDILTQLGLSRPFLMSDAYLVEGGMAQALLDALTDAGMPARLFADTMPEPDVASIERAVVALRAGDHDCVIGFGGGSPIDSAKAVAVLATHGGAMRDYKAPHQQDTPGLPVIAIPTTAGTGSEATRFTIVTDSEKDEKMLCIGLAYLPVAALVDYELTLSMPPRLTADTGIDALTHAVEAYVSKRANPVSDGFALQAIQLMAPNLRRVWADGQDRAAREAMMLGATYAGIAFSNSSVALVHGMSRPIGAHFHVPHGLSNAMLLPLVTAFSASGDVRRYADCARAMDIAQEGEGDQMAVNRLVEELSALNRDLAVPDPRGYGIARDAWERLTPLMVEQAIASGSPANNPRVPTPQEMRALYERAWAGA
ncbi:iron-containing alcohol dehydrogenase [Sphingobium nicotianae]|uniref:Alcohol dehydrogenase 2 n=1 Tax=Sphingobium nicotianae TaxID=2782607 RepID=A0A9X1DDA8_9SPHN|nr:iron-containing alcohol dehydrogenase [Sphingobium nicotianae]MBT2187790.1 iron-containing alcohol dehydrogenase [Sphingobium nicotianae]